MPYGAATRFMAGETSVLTSTQAQGAIRFSESFGYDMATNRLVRPGAARRTDHRALDPGAETDDGSVGYLDLWGSRRRERDTLPWHERRGPKNAPTTTIGKTRSPAEPREARRPYAGPVRP